MMPDTPLEWVASVSCSAVIIIVMLALLIRPDSGTEE